MKQHIEPAHERKKPFKCDVYDYSSSQKFHLNLYISSVHDQTKPFKYELCDYDCSRKSILKNHVAKVHERIIPFIHTYMNCVDKMFRKSQRRNGRLN